MLTNFRIRVAAQHNTHSVYRIAMHQLCRQQPDAQQCIHADDESVHTVFRDEHNAWRITSTDLSINLQAPGDNSIDIYITPDGRCNEIHVLYCGSYESLHGSEQWFAGVMADLIELSHPLYPLDVEFPSKTPDYQWSDEILAAPVYSLVRRAWFDRLGRAAELRSL